MEDRMCSSLPLSLIFSLIDKLFVLFNTLLRKRQETSFFHQINFTIKIFAQ